MHGHRAARFILVITALLCVLVPATAAATPSLSAAKNRAKLVADIHGVTSVNNQMTVEESTTK